MIYLIVVLAIFLYANEITNILADKLTKVANMLTILADKLTIYFG
jgi:hypothetical protein